MGVSKCVYVSVCVCMYVRVCRRKTKDRADGMKEKVCVCGCVWVCVGM